VRNLFQHDNAPSHKAQQTITFLQNNSIDILDSWPPYSPDLNVIENMWAHMKYVVRRENIGSKEHLRARIMEVWNSQETKEVCCRLTDSMPKRIKLCIQNQGGFTKY
jgi:transposase